MLFGSLTTHDVRLMGRKEATSLRDFPALSNQMFVATPQIPGQSASKKDEFNMDSNSWRAKGLSDLRNESRMLSRPAAPFFLIADCNSPIRSGAQLPSSTNGTLRRSLNFRLMSRLDCDFLSLMTLA